MADPTYTSVLTNPYGLTAVDRNADPTFVDIDGDGDLDVFIGRYDGSVSFFRNTGSATNPVYASPTDNPFNITDTNGFSSPEFVDIDGDGDLDLFVGTWYAHVEFYRNTGTASNPSFATKVVNPFGFSNNNGNFKPEFVDIDADGDKDAFVGSNDGSVTFYRNIGNASSPNFQQEGGATPFGLTDVGRATGAKFADIDNDGDYDAFVGEWLGNVYFFRNTGNASSASFAAPTTNPFGLTHVASWTTTDVVDIDGDSDLDIILGGYAGSSFVFLNNILPTLTGFASTVASGNEDSEIAVSFSNLQTQGNEADSDGTVTAFVVKAVSTGSLKIGTSAATATAWVAGSNDTIDATHQAYWTPAANANGVLNAFTVTAQDNNTGQSASPVQAQINVASVNDLPTLSSFASTVASGNEDSEISVSFSSLQSQGNEADSDGTVTAFVVKAVSTGSLKIGTSAATATAWATGSNDTIDATHQAYWTPAANANGVLNAFTVTTQDNNAGQSASPVQAQINVASVNDLPTLSSFASTVASGNEDSEISVSFSSLQSQGNEADSDGTVTAFVVKAVSTGSLKIGTSAATATAWVTGSNDTIDATHQAYWTPAANANGVLNAFTVAAQDNNAGQSTSPVQAQINVSAVNDLPTLTSFASTVASGNEDSEIAVSFSNLQTQGNEADSDGTVTAFIVKAVSTGSLKIGTSAATATAWVTGSNDTIDATHQAYWTPAANANGVLNAFTVTTQDNNAGQSNSPVQAQINVTAVNDLPTLTSFASTVASGNEDSEIAVSFSNLQSQGNEADSDGTVTAFVVKAVSTGSLKIGTSAATATVWVTGSNDTIDATHQAYWTPDANANGVLNAFTVTAQDNNTGQSTSPVQAQINVASVNDLPTLSSFASTVASGNEDSEIAVSFSNLQTQGNEADSDGTVTAFVVKAVSTGSLKIGTSAATATAWVAGSNDTIDATHQAYWTPDANANGVLNAFTVAAQDNNTGQSTSPVQAQINVASVNDLPTLSSFASTVASGNEDSEIAVSFSNLQTQGNEADSDGTVTAFVVKAVSTGSLKIGTSAATATSWVAGSNDTIDATHQAYWTPAANANGVLNAFTVTAKDNNAGESIAPEQAQVDVTLENDLPIGLPVITGTATQGQTLTVVTSGISDADGLGSFSYVWKANGAVISGATNSTYRLTEAEVSKTLTVEVSYTDGHNTAEGPLASLATAVVTNTNEAPVGLPAISGTATQGQLLTAVTNGISDADGLGSFSYVWKANGVVISGATNNTYRLTETEVGKTLTVEVSYTDGHSTAEGPLASLATAVVTNINDAPVGLPTISGTATQGQTLTAVTAGISDADGLGSFSYVWKANGVVISGATNNTYRLTETEVGKTITVEVSYIDGHNTAEGPLASLATDAVVGVEPNHHAPTDIALSSADVNENVASNSIVGYFSTVDSDVGDSFSYSFVAGANDNNLFTLTGNQLRMVVTTNFEAKSSYSISIRSSDQDGLFVDKTFTINVVDQNDKPVIAHGLVNQAVVASHAFSYTVAINSFYDEDVNDVLTYNALLADGSALPAWLNFDTRTLTFSGIPTDADVGQINIKLTALDSSNASVSSSFTLDIANIAPNTAPVLSLFHNDSVGYALALQPDGKLLVAGYSESLEHKNIILLRYNSDGSLDTGFADKGKATLAVGLFDSIANAVAIQDDGKIVVAGINSDGSNSDIAVVRFNATGQLDTSFSDDGQAAFSLSTGIDYAHAVDIQADGKILVAGYYDHNGNNDFVLLRYDTEGRLDADFSNDGVASADFGGSNDNAYAMAIQSDGKILLAGAKHGEGATQFAVARYNIDGSLDTTFSYDGKVVTALNTFDDQAHAMSIQSNGDILVAGESWNGNDNNFALVRYHSDGSLDTSFSADGKLVTNLNGSYDYARSMYVQMDGKIVVSGYSKTGEQVALLMLRYNSDGSLDSDFGDQGKVVAAIADTNSFSYAVTEQSNGQILLTGYTSDASKQTVTVARFNQDGSLQSVFANTQTVNVSESAILINKQASLYDAELAVQGNYEGLAVTLMRHGGAVASDVFGSSGSLTLKNGLAVVSGVTIGIVSNGQGSLTLTFNANANQTLVDAALSALTYLNTGAQSPMITIDWLVNDGNNGAQGSGGALATLGSSTLYFATDETPLTLAAPPAINYSDTKYVDNFNSVTGQLSYQGVSDGVVTYGLLGGVDKGDGSISKHSAYGVLTLDKTTGSYSFAPKLLAIEALTTGRFIYFTVTVDNSLETDSERITIDIKQLGKTESQHNDHLAGSQHNDAINALKGNDKLYGKAGIDTLIGGNGNDTINGGDDADVLTGGKGKDSFIVDGSFAQGLDTITDFSAVADVIKLNHAVFTAFNHTGVIDPEHFVRAEHAQDANDYLIYQADTGIIAYDADGNGVEEAVAILQVGAQLNIRALDFVVF